MADLSQHTYMVRHNPNCPSPFEVRTCGDAGLVDPKERRNLVSYGKTLDEAMRAAAQLIDDRERCHRLKRAEEPFIGILWA